VARKRLAAAVARLTVAGLTVASLALALSACASPRQLNVTEEPVARRTPGSGAPSDRAVGAEALVPPAACPAGVVPASAAGDLLAAARVHAAWDRIEGWLGVHAPASLATLNPPADADRIAAAEAAMSVRFPPDLVASLRRHDGVRTGDPRIAFRLPPGYVPLSLAEARQDRGARCQLAELRGRGRDGASWQATYVPFARDATGGCLLVDTRAAGRVGMGDREGGVSFVGQPPTLADLLDRTAAALTTGQPYGRWRPSVNEYGGLDWQES
jgi:cell wall assembly regulator SMI1